MVCLDTGIIIEILKGNERIKGLISEYAKSQEVTATTITEYELMKYKDLEKRELAVKSLDELKLYALDRSSAREAATLFRNLVELGATMPENDLLIAGIALTNSETLITTDKHFSAIKNSNIVVI